MALNAQKLPKGTKILRVTHNIPGRVSVGHVYQLVQDYDGRKFDSVRIIADCGQEEWRDQQYFDVYKEKKVFKFN